MDRRSAITAALALVAAETARPQDSTSHLASGTAQERAAKVAIVRDTYGPGDVRRYGALGDGASDDSSAWRAAFATGHRVLGGGAEYTYCLDGQVPITRATIVDLQGATVRPRGNTFGFIRSAPPPTVSNMVSGGAVQGSRTLTLASTAGLKVGQWTRLILNDYPAHDASSYPPSWTRIAAVHGNAIELETPLQISYGTGALQLAAYDAGVLCERFECRNGVFDGSQLTLDSGTGQALRIGGTERVVVQGCEFRDFRHDGALTCAVELFQNVDVLVSECRFTGCISHFDICDIQDARFAHFVNNQMDGAHFGCNLTRIDSGLFAHNSLQGRHASEAAGGAPARSVRGLKAYGCASIRMLGNQASDYESPIKVQACFRYDVSHNTIFNGGVGAYTGQIALNVGSIVQGHNMRDGRVIGNLVECCGGIGIGITSDSPGGVCVADNIVRATQGMGIYVNVANAIVSGNRVADWGLRNGGDAAIHASGAASVVDNRFAHATLTGLACLALARTDERQLVRDNVSESGNRLT